VLPIPGETFLCGSERRGRPCCDTTMSRSFVIRHATQRNGKKAIQAFVDANYPTADLGWAMADQVRRRGGESESGELRLTVSCSSLALPGNRGSPKSSTSANMVAGSFASPMEVI